MIPDAPDTTRNQSDPSAESTDLHSPDAAPPPSLRRSGADTGAYPGSGQSIRIHSRAPRSGLALRLTLPVVAAALLSLAIVCLIAHHNARSLVLDDLRADTANVVFTGSAFARVLLTQHDRFHRENPALDLQPSRQAAEHLLPAPGFVSDRDWTPATGYPMDVTVPSAALRQAGITASLAELSRFLNAPPAETEIVAFFILGADDDTIASCRKESFRFDPAALRAVPRIGGQYDVGNTSIIVDYVPDIEPEPLMRGTARIFTNDAEKRRLGTAIAVLRARPRLARANSFFLLLLGLSALCAGVIASAAWLAGRRIAIPLRRLSADMRAIAEGDYTRRAAVRENDETSLAAQAFNSMAERLRLARLNEQETERLESDLQTARDVQANLIPRQAPFVRGLDIHTAYRPAKAIGGDYFDFLPVDDAHVGLVVADASGKSIPAALVMATTRAILRFVAPGVASAAETLARVNAILSVDIPRGMFVTAYYVVLDPATNSMLCASAGHTPLLIARRDGSVEMLNPGGIALGFDGGGIFQRSLREQRVRLEAGDRALLYTDGVVECANQEDEEYSERRLREFLRRNREMSSHDFVGALMADLDRHRGPAEIRDDTTIATFRVV